MAWLLLLLCAPAFAGTFTKETIEAGGRTRSYSLYAPSAPARGLAALFLLHGGNMDAKQVRLYTQRRFEGLGERKGFLVVYPDAYGKYWNAGVEKVYKAAREGVDDTGFLAAVSERLVKERGADRRRLYAVGISNGAVMVHRLACEDAVRWAAVAALEGALGAETAAACRPARPVPILMVHGTADKILAWESRKVNMIITQIGARLNVPETTAKWVALDHCAGNPEKTDLPDKDPGDGTRWQREAWRRCRAGSEVLFYKVDGGGHTWPNGLPNMTMIVGRISRDVDIEPLLWSFLSRHRS